MKTLCACGRVARAFCVQCREPLCKGHATTLSYWAEDDEGYFDLPARLRWNLFPELEEESSLGGDVDRGELPEWVQHELEKHKLPPNDSVLCKNCGCERYAIIKAIGKQLG